MRASATRRRSPSATPFDGGAVIFVLRQDISLIKGAHITIGGKKYFSGPPSFVAQGRGVERELHGAYYVVAHFHRALAGSDLPHGGWHYCSEDQGFRLDTKGPHHKQTASLPSHRVYALTNDGIQKFCNAIR